MFTFLVIVILFLFRREIRMALRRLFADGSAYGQVSDLRFHLGAWKYRARLHPVKTVGVLLVVILVIHWTLSD